MLVRTAKRLCCIFLFPRGSRSQNLKMIKKNGNRQKSLFDLPKSHFLTSDHLPFFKNVKHNILPICDFLDFDRYTGGRKSRFCEMFDVEYTFVSEI